MGGQGRVRREGLSGRSGADGAASGLACGTGPARRCQERWYAAHNASPFHCHTMTYGSDTLTAPAALRAMPWGLGMSQEVWP